MTLEEFIKKYDGRHIDWDNYPPNNPYQCTDLYRFYLKEVWGAIQTSPVVGAKDIFDTIGEGYEKILNTPTGVPQKGDVVIYDGRIGGGYGHVSIFIDGNTDNFRCFEQNRPTGSPCHVGTSTYSAVKGWFRPAIIKPEPIAPPMTFTDQTKIPVGRTELRNWGEMELQALRGELNDLLREAQKVEGLEKKLGELEARYAKMEEEYTTLVKNHKDMKTDFTNSLQVLGDKNKIYRALVEDLARELGTSQRIEEILPATKQMNKENSQMREKLKAIADGRPVAGDNLIVSLVKLLKLFFTRAEKELTITKPDNGD